MCQQGNFHQNHNGSNRSKSRGGPEMEQRDNPYGFEDCGHETSSERPHLSVTGQPMAS